MTEPVVIPKQPPVKRGYPTVETRRKMRADYVQGKGTLVNLCLKYGVSESTGKRWCSAEDWTLLREQFDGKDLALLQPVPLTAPVVAPVLTPTQSRLDRIEKQLEQIEKDLEGASPQAKRDLTAAHSRLFDSYCTLAGIQKPGTRKSRRDQRPAPPAAPIPQPVVSEGNPIEENPPLPG